ncbi:MAG: GAF domain-containing protein [Anaerolineae bacterium]|nr:GAF domain-containing protein [Anaerolineae bacterium]
MVEVYLVITGLGLVLFTWLYFLVRQIQQGFDSEYEARPRPVVPVNLMDSDEAVLVAEGRGRIVYANDLARQWFGMNGGVPNLALMAQMVHPPDTLHDLFADVGHASFHLGQRRIEAVSHAIPSPSGQRMVVVMREVSARAAMQPLTDFDPLRAMAILSDISSAVGAGLDLDAIVNVVLDGVARSIAYDGAEITLWQPETKTLCPVAVLGDHIAANEATDQTSLSYAVGEGYSGWIAMYRQPLMIGDAAARTDVSPKTAPLWFQSFIGVPLFVADRFMGTLELTSRERNAFGQRDLALLQAIAPQVAAAVEAGQLYRDQTARVAELSGLQRITEAMSQLGEPYELYGQVTQRIAQLMDVDLCGLLIFDDDEGVFHSQLPFFGVPDSLVEHYRLVVAPDTELYTIWNHQAWWFTNDPEDLLIQSLGFDDLIAVVTLNQLALAPMMVGTRRIGLLVVANKRDRSNLNETDMRALMTFAAQAAIVAENARLYNEEQRRTRELGGLQQIAQALGVLRQPKELYGQITTRIAELMDVKMCGLLLYDPKEQVLVSQRPFYGMDDEESVAFYQLPSPPDSPVARLWQEQDIWHSNDLRGDPEVGESDLAQMAAMIGIHKTMIAALTVGDARLGIIQVADRTDDADFTRDDVRLFGIFARQAAILVDNARLYREMQRRTHEAEGLRGIAEIASRVAPLPGTMGELCAAIANLLQSEVVLLALVDEQTGQLTIAPDAVHGTVLEQAYQIDAYAPGFEHSVLVSRRPFQSHNLDDDPNALEQYRDLAGQLGLRDAILVPLIVQDRSIGELVVANRAAGDMYTDADLQLLRAIATQVTAMIDRARLYQSTDADLRTRVQELGALNRVSHELSQTIELDRVLDVIRQEALRSTAVSAASIVLLADREDWKDQDQPEIERRFGETDALTDLTPVERAAIETGARVIVADYADDEFDAVPDEARSALVVPVMFGDQVAGLLHLYSDEPGAFNQRVIEFGMALSNQAAIAIGNAVRYQDQLQANRQLQVRAERMGRIFELGKMFREGASLAHMLEEVAHSVQETVGFNVVLISLADHREGVLRRIAQAGLPLADFEEIQAVTPSLDQARGLMQDAYRVSNSYFLPSGSTEDLREDLPIHTVHQAGAGRGPRDWNPDDLMLVPFYGSGGQLLGLMSVDDPRSGRRPNRAIIEALEIFAGQAAFSIENYRLVERIQQEAEAARRERDRLAQLHMVTSEIQGAPDVPSRLQVVANGIHDAGWGHVIITLRDEHLEPTALIQAGYTPDEAMRLSDEVLSGEVWTRWINDLAFHEHKLGVGYYLRYDRPWVREHLLKGETPDPASVPDDEWHPQDVLYLPLVGQDQKRIIGIIEMTDPVDGSVPTEQALQPFELFASQAAAAIETTRLYLETVRAAEQEQSLNRMMELISSSLDSNTVVQAIGSGLQQMVPFTRMNMALYDNQMACFEVLRAEISLDGSVEVVKGSPLNVDGTAVGLAYREMEPRIYRLHQEAKARKANSDLANWYESGERSTLIVPMVTGGQAVGVLHLGSELENAFGFQENLELIQRLANLSAVALDNARLFQQAREREQFSLAMRRVSQSLNQIIDLSSVLNTICDESLPVLGVEGAYVWLVVGNDLVGIAASGSAQAEFSGMAISLSDSQALAARVVTEQRAIYINNLQDRTDRAQIVPLAQLQSVQAILGVPLLREDEVLGALMLVEAEAGQRFDDLSVEQASAFAVQAAIAIENARLFEEAEQRANELDAQARRLALVNRISTRLAQSLDAEEIYQIALNELQEVLGAQFGGMVIFEDESRGRLVLDTYPADGGDVELALVDNLSVDYVRRTHKPLAADDVLSDPRFEGVWDVLEKRGTQSIMLVPLIVGDDVIGTIGLDFTQRRIFSETEIELTETIASQVSVALDKATLLKEAEQRATELNAQAHRLATLNRFSAQLAQTLDMEEIYRITLTEMQEAIGVQYSGLMLIQEDRIESKLVLSTHPLDDPLPDLRVPLKGNPVAEYMLETRQPLVAEDLLNDPRFESMWDVEEARDTRAMLIVPVNVGGQMIGTIGLDSSSPRRFTETEIGLATTMANQAGVSIEKARLYAEAEQRAVELNQQAGRLALINRVSTRLAQTLDPQEVYSIVLTELVEILEMQFGGVILFEDDQTGRLIVNYPVEGPTPDITISLEGNQSIERVRETHKPLASEDVLNDPLFEKVWDMLRGRGTRSLMIIPLVVGDEVIGTIGLDATEIRTFTETEIEMAETITSQASLAVEKARLYDETLGLTIFNQAVVESIRQGIVVLDRDLVVRRVNRYMIERYGWETSAIGRTLFDYRPDYQDFLRQLVAVVLGVGEPQVYYEAERLDVSGEQSIRNYYLYPMLEGRTVSGIVLLVEDVTERTRLEADLNARAVQMAALSEVSSQITATLEPDQVISLILDALADVIPYDRVSLWLRSPSGDELRVAAARHFQDVEPVDADDLVGLTVEIPFSPLFQEMSKNAQVINVGDVSAGDPRFPYGSAAAYKNWLGAPLISKGDVVGVLTLEKRDPNFYSALHEQLALTFANQAAVAMDNAQLFQETRDRAIALDEQAQRLALLNRVSLALAQSLDLENIFEITLRETALALGIEEGAAIQVDGQNQLARVVVNYPRDDAPPQAVYDLSRNRAFERLQTSLLPFANEDLANDPYADDLRSMMRREDVQSTLLVPLLVGGNMIGVLRLDVCGEPRQFTDSQIELAQTIANQAAIAVQNAGLYEQTSIRTKELETLFESAQATAVTLDLNEVSRRVTMQTLSALRSDACTVFLWDDVGHRLEVRGDISARPDEAGQIQVGDMISLADYPLREKALTDREPIIVRADDEDLPPGEMRLMTQHGAASRMLLPLIVNEVSIGLVEVETVDSNRFFTADDERMARTLGSQAAISIENARLQTETRRTVEELYIINDMSAALSSAVTLDQLLEVVADQLPSLIEVETIYVALYDSDQQRISFPLAVSHDKYLEMSSRPLGSDEFSKVIERQSSLLLVGDNLPEVRRSLGIDTALKDTSAFLGVPLFAGEAVIGVLALRDDADSMAFGHSDPRILTTVGSQLGVAIQSVRLFQQTLQLAEELERRVDERTAELEQERQHISTLYQITTELATSLDVERLLSRSLEMVAEAVGATYGAILAVEPISEELHYRARVGWPEDLPKPPSPRLNEGLVGWAVQRHESLVVDDVQKDPRWLRLSEVDDLPQAAMIALIEAGEDVLGVMTLYSEETGAFTKDHLRLVTAAANQVANAMNNAELYTLIRDQAERLGTMLRQEQIEATKSASILDSIADGVMVSDANGQVIVFNSTAERILGLSAEQVLNQPTSAFAGLYGTGSWIEIIDRWISDPTQYRPGEFMEERITLEDERVISVRLAPVHMGDQFLGTVSVFRDITRDVEVDKLKSEFVATVSHELRTPMTSIKGYADLLLLGAAGAISEQQQRFLETIKQNADRLSTLVNDLLDISRIDQGRVDLKFSTVDVEELLNLLVDYLHGRAEDEKRQVEVAVDMPVDKHLSIWGDHDKVTQIFTNLADNAFNYTETGGSITFSAQRDSETGGVVVSIADTGIGIPPEVHDRIYDRFFRGDEAHELVMDTPGTGLGLSIVREFVQMHAGEIWFESEVGKGTTFHVRLPSKAAEAVSSGVS